ncbi:MAG: type 1 glutamine amidotransferase [Verrucomicrobiota bacterium]
MRRAVCITNVAHEGPGLLGNLVADAGFSLSQVEAWKGERWPTDVGAADLVIVMGGPMGVADIGKPGFEWLGDVTELLRRRLAADHPCIGVCLGMQLMAHAAGAKVAPMCDAEGAPVREVGWGSLELVGASSILAGLPRPMDVLHWHGDACERPEGAELLASTPACPVQMFSLGRSVGMQFHPEVDGATACIWASEDAAFVRAANGPDGVHTLQTASPAAAARTSASRHRLLSNVLRHVLRP